LDSKKYGSPIVWDKVFRSEVKKTQKVNNVGKTRGYPFCMSYLFAKSKTELVCGSLDLIEKYAKLNFKLCHGMVHYYIDKKVQSKQWFLFSEDRRLYLQRVRSGEKTIPYALQKFLDPKPKQTKYYLLFNDVSTRKIDVLASWRKLPSTYIKEFDDILEDLGEDSVEDIVEIF